MESRTHDLTPRTIAAPLLAAPDLLVIAIWAAAICCAAALRVNFIGDGVRHLSPILDESRPQLGEARWLLFPAFLFAIIKPLQIAGLVNSLDAAVRAFLTIDYFAGLAYMLLIRKWLIDKSVTPTSRAAALVLAGMTVPMLRFSTDIVEVIVPATISLAGLVYLASRPLEQVNKGLCVAAAAIAFAALLYQGTVLAVALIPCAIPRGARVRMRAIVLFCAILAVTPAVMLAAIVVNGASPRTAIHLILTGEENPLFRDRLASHRLLIWERPLAAVSLGAARSIIEIPDNLGVGGSLRLLSHRATFVEGAIAIGGCLIALVIVVAGAALVFHRREWRIALAFAGILILPIVRGYAYLKLYVLMPIVVALIAAISPPAVVLGAAAIAGSFNATYLANDIARDRRLNRAVAPLYLRAGASACWVTTGWGPPLFGWPGTICSMSQVLTQANTSQLDTMILENNAAMVHSLRRCFCDSSSVFTDDIAVSSGESVAGFAKYYGFTGIDLSQFLWSPQNGTTAFDTDGIVIRTYSRSAQSEICKALKAAGNSQSR
jgi:hypothetical protein